MLVAAGLACFALAPADARFVTDVLPGDRADRHRRRAVLPGGDDAGDDRRPPGATPGLASGLVNTTAQVGGAIGLAVLTTVSTERTSGLRSAGAAARDALTGGYHAAFWASVALVAAALVVTLTVLRPVATASDAVEEQPVPIAA